jgi:hypothetical protein
MIIIVMANEIIKEQTLELHRRVKNVRANCSLSFMYLEDFKPNRVAVGEIFLLENIMKQGYNPVLRRLQRFYLMQTRSMSKSRIL